MCLIGLSWIPRCIIGMVWNKRLCLNSWFWHGTHFYGSTSNSLCHFTDFLWFYEVVPDNLFLNQREKFLAKLWTGTNTWLLVGWTFSYTRKVYLIGSEGNVYLMFTYSTWSLLSHFLTYSISYCLLISHCWSNEVREKYLKMVIYYNILILLFVISLVFGCELLLLENIKLSFLCEDIIGILPSLKCF